MSGNYVVTVFFTFFHCNQKKAAEGSTNGQKLAVRGSERNKYFLEFYDRFDTKFGAKYSGGIFFQKSLSKVQ